MVDFLKMFKKIGISQTRPRGNLGVLSYICTITNQSNNMLRFSDGVEIDTSGPLRVLTLSDGHYVVGKGMLIPVNNLEEAQKIIQGAK